mgnify:CR=1 FL=1
MPEVELCDVAWAAGVFDQGGYVRERNRTLYLRMWFPLVKAKAERFKRIVGVGKVYGPYRRGRLFAWQYELTGRAKVSSTIGMLHPYLTRPCRYEGLIDARGGSQLGETSSFLIEEAQNPVGSPLTMPNASTSEACAERVRAGPAEGGPHESYMESSYLA